MEFKDYYEIMSVKRDATQDVIKRAYRKKTRKYHPDVSKFELVDEGVIEPQGREIVLRLRCAMRLQNDLGGQPCCCSFGI